MILNYIIAFTKLVAKVAKKNDNKNEKLQSVYNTNAQKEKSLSLFRGGQSGKMKKRGIDKEAFKRYDRGS